MKTHSSESCDMKIRIATSAAFDRLQSMQSNSMYSASLIQWWRIVMNWSIQVMTIEFSRPRWSWIRFTLTPFQLFITLIATSTHQQQTNRQLRFNRYTLPTYKLINHRHTLHSGRIVKEVLLMSSHSSTLSWKWWRANSYHTTHHQDQYHTHDTNDDGS